MSDITYRVAEPVEEKTTTTQSTAPVDKSHVEIPLDVETPFTEFEGKNGKPYPVEYFDLGRYWNTGEIYTKEVETISTYLNHLVNTGVISNTTKSVGDKLKSIEKMIGSSKDDRRAARVGMVAAHIEFLMKADGIRKNAAKYGMI